MTSNNLDWKKVRFIEAVSINPRESLTKGSLSKKVSMSDIIEHTKEIKDYSFEEYKSGPKFRQNDTLFARITPSLENGKTAKVNILAEDELGFGSTEFIVMRAKPDITDEDFVYYLSRWDGIRDPAIKSMTGTSGRQRVQNSIFENLIINLPPLSEQKQIANILSSFDDKIENNNAIIANLEDQAQAIFKSWFMGKSKSRHLEGTVSDLGQVVAGGTPSKKKSEYYNNGDIPWITPKDLSNTSTKFVSKGATDITSLGLEKSSAKLMPRGTVLFSSRAPIGYIAIAKNDVSTNQGFKSVVPFEDIGTPYTYYFLKNNTKLIKNMASGSTFKEISGSAMKKIPAIIPDKNLLKKFNSFCRPIFLYQESLEAQNTKLEEIRDTLLPKLMSGEIRVGEASEVK